MALFSYKAKTPDGRVIDGQIEADNEASLMAKMKAQKMTVISVTKQGGLKALLNLGPKVKTADISIFCRQFSTMIAAGLPVMQALTIQCEQQEDKVFKEVLTKVRDDIAGGANLSDAMSKFPNVFNALFCNMVRAGEMSGALDKILDRLSTYLEKAEALTSKIKGAMTYPATISVIVVIVVIVLMVKVVPSFKTVFESFGGGLPPITQSLIDISEFEQKYALVEVVGIAAFIFLFGIAKRSDKGGFIIDSIILKTPIFGPLVKKTAVARFARTLGTLLSSGVGILDALDTVARSSGNRVIEKALMDTKAAVREGQPLTEPMKATGLFPPMVVQMVAVGEETGKLDEMLLRMSDFYDAEVDTAVDALMGMMEPLIMVVLCVVVGYIVIAIFVPMFSMGGLVA
ncbi:MAG: type II secretion system F family protein [Spirochaetia bacterium]|nr:type II secretion system F family protein [Spirochaetia bacterium]